MRSLAPLLDLVAIANSTYFMDKATPEDSYTQAIEVVTSLDYTTTICENGGDC